MDYQKIAENVLKKAIQSGVNEAEVFLQNSREFELNVRKGDVETVKQSASKGIGLTVYKDKKIGFSYTSDLSLDSLSDFIKKTIDLSLVSDSKPWNGLADFEKGEPEDLDLWDPSISNISNSEKIEIAKKVEKIALSFDKRIKNSEGGFYGDSEEEIFVVNSKGISRRAKGTGVYFGTGVIAGEGNSMQSGWWNSSKNHFKDLMDIEEVAKEAGQRAVEKLGAKPVKTQKVPLIMDRYAARSFWLGILRAFDGDNVFKKTTFLTDFLDKPIASSLVTLVDDPTIPRHIASRPFDGEGKTTHENTLIEKGILKMFIYDSITARKAGVNVNTLTRRGGYRSLPYGSFINVIIQNGTENKDKIISGIKEGFYVKGLRGIGTDVSTGNFSVGASGFWIRNGELAFPVDGVTLGGNTIDILKNVESVADDLDMRGSLNSPSFKISEIIVGGKK